ncbi:MAG TPA: two-component regulator propeller domain-containing protein [Opitutus sp.]|nr:two-component regulator propeller domain-containing protein [Opitutus sp.]
MFPRCLPSHLLKIVVFLATALVAPAQASGTRFTLANWQAQDGLPSNKVMSVLQTRDGYLWAGTHEGLVRFDGVRFTHVENPRTDARIDTSVITLHETPDGTLWIGHASGSISSYRDGKFTQHPRAEANRSVRIQRLGSDRSGDVWSLNVEGALVRVRDGLGLRPESGGSRGIFGMVGTPNGSLWVNCRGHLSELRDGKLHPVPLLRGMNGWVQGLAGSPDNGVWIVAGERLWKYAKGRWSAAFGRVATGSTPIYDLVELSDGRLLAGTFEEGAWLITPEPFAQQRLWRGTDFPSDWILSAHEDHEGSWWIATGTAGLFRLRNEKLRMLVPEDNWQARSVLAVTQTRAGDIWATTEGAGVYRHRDGEWKRYAREAGVENTYVWTVAEDADGRLLIGTWGMGVFQLVGERFVRAPGMEKLDIAVAALTPAKDGGVFVGSLSGVLHYKGDEARWLEADAEHRLKDVRYILEDDGGAVWVGCNGDGLGRIENGRARQYLRGDGLSSNFVRCLYKAADGALWIGTRGGGLNRFQDGTFAVITSAQGLVDDIICYMEDDGRGSLWIASHGGIMRVPLAELNACADGKIPRVNSLSYGLDEGLLTLAASGPLQSAGCRLPTGELLFATTRGLALIDPAKVAINTQPPPVRIESARVGDRTLFEAGAVPSAIEVRPGEHRIEIRYTALSFVAPEKVRFKRRLVGLEPELTEVGAERTATYSFVPPGEYTFQVTAANNDHVWNEQLQGLRVVVRPHFWQTAWFRLGVFAAVIAGVAGLAWSVSRQRLRRQLERLERARAIEAERTRIANEMHDDLGAHLTRITMLSDAARAELNEPERLEKGLAQIYDTARNVTRAMDEIVWAVNPKHDTLESLVCYLEKFAQDFLGAAGIRVRLDLPLDYADWSPSTEVRHNLFLCYKEALNNAVRHSSADTVTVVLKANDAECVVQIVDNGRGLDAVADDRGERFPRERVGSGNGLVSMQRRMSEIGGRCELSAAPGGGTCVTLVIPLTKAGLRVSATV